jgi:hypothetical protein
VGYLESALAQQGNIGAISASEWVSFVALRVELKNARIMVLNYFFSKEFTLRLLHNPHIKP